jgi:nucleotide-binding universal stress UspA family protein
MNRFRNVLLVHHPDPTETSGLQRAVEVARRNSARLRILDVLPELPGDPDLTVRGVNVHQAIIRERRERLEWLLEPIREEGIDATFDVRVGSPFVEITRTVLRHEHDLVVKTARGPGGLRGRLLGSTALHLMRKCPAPVWIVKPGSRARYRRILAAVDPVAPGAGAEINVRILELTTSLASLEDAEPHIVHAWQMDDSLASWRLPHEYVAKVRAETESKHQDRLGGLLDSHDTLGIEHSVHLERGRPADVIVSLADRLQPDLVVMGTVCRTGIAGFFIGNTAEEVLQRVDCSVLTVKPDAFVSPIVLEERSSALAT